MTSLRLRIRTPSRLHFGLLGWGPHLLRQFGGIGLMIDSPGIELVGRAGTGLDGRGPARGSSRTDRHSTSIAIA